MRKPIIWLLPLLAAAAVSPAALTAGPGSPEASACRINGGTDFLRDLLFAQASREPSAEQSTVTDLKRASKVDLANARVVAYDAQSGRIECAGDVQLTVPAQAAAAFGGQSQLTTPTRFTAEPSSDGHGFTIFVSRMTPLSSQIAIASKALGPTRLTPVAAAEAATPAPAIKFGEARPAFDCALAATAVEVMLCSDPELAERDRREAAQYFALRNYLPPKVRRQLLESQRLFLRQRAGCSTSQCLSDLYDERLRRLKLLASNAAR